MRAFVNPWRDLARLPRGVWILSAATLVNRAGTMVRPFLTLYLTQALGFDAERTAVVLFLFGLASLLGQLVSGRLCDLVSPWRVLVVALLLGGALCTLVAVPRTFAGVCAAVSLWSFVAEAYRPASTTVLSELVGADALRTAYALLRLAINLGMSIGPVVGGFLAEISFEVLFVIDGITTMLAGVILGVWALRTGLLARRDLAAKTAHAVAWGALRDRRFLLFLVAVVPSAMVFFQIEGAWPIHMTRELGLSKAWIGGMLAINTVLIVLTEIPLNVWTNRWSAARSIVIGTLCTGVGFGMLAFVPNLAWVAASIVVWTVGEMILFPALSAEATLLAPEGRRGEYLGLFHTAFAVASMTGPALGTLVLDRAGPAWLWGGAFVASLVSAALFARAARRDA
jgi:predicted MFS family arabinose efflux permease